MSINETEPSIRSSASVSSRMSYDSDSSSTSSSKVALVVGGSKGIGLASAKVLAESGFIVVVGSRSGVSVDGLPGVVLDASNLDSIESCFAKVAKDFGPVSVLVYSAGFFADSLLMRMSDKDVCDVLDTNLLGAIRCAKLALPSMIRSKFGRIIFISSVSGFLGSPGQVNYAASKTGLIGVARSLTREVGSKNITVNVVVPGFIDTDLTSSLPQDKKDLFKALTPANRVGSPSDVAFLVNFLASDNASFISGALIPVDGGLGMGL